MKILIFIISLTSCVYCLNTKAISSDDFSSLIELSIERVYNDSVTPTVLATVTNKAKYKMSLIIVECAFFLEGKTTTRGLGGTQNVAVNGWGTLKAISTDQFRFDSAKCRVSNAIRALKLPNGQRMELHPRTPEKH